jgi:hypothetical protein
MESSAWVHLLDAERGCCDGDVPVNGEVRVGALA